MNISHIAKRFKKLSHKRVLFVLLGGAILCGCGEGDSFRCESTQVQESIKQMLKIEAQSLARDLDMTIQDVQITLSSFKVLQTSPEVLKCQVVIESNISKIQALSPLVYELKDDLQVTLQLSP